MNSYSFILFFFLPILWRRKKRRLSAYEQYLISEIATTQKVPSSKAKSIYYKSLKNSIGIHFNFAYLMNLPTKLMLMELKNIDIINEEILTTLEATNRPIIMASIHSGDFNSGFLKLASTSKTKRTINIVKLSKQSPKEERMITRIKEFCSNINILRFNNEIAKICFFQLRKNNIVAIMNDVEVRVNKRVPVDFMGRKCHFQCGIAQLAIPAKAMTLPVINYKDSQGNNVIKIEQPLDSQLQENENTQAAIQRLTQAIASHMESWITDHPEQFHCWEFMTKTLNAKENDKVNWHVQY
ncbi:lysophospholipid acyltransferase family protein [Psychrobium sp. nBUS_13]|uniref:lysophospholipid acyltransferase family protein n=1 Tax=Psychrobium sp. nBUS_13 TaxID=3395319 RepID=UPI003EBF3B3E